MSAPFRLWPWLALAACAGALGQTAPKPTRNPSPELSPTPPVPAQPLAPGLSPAPTAPAAQVRPGVNKWAEWEAVQRQLKLGDIHLSAPAVKAGEELRAACQLRNDTGGPVMIPNNREFFDVNPATPKNLLGLERWWIRRLGPDPSIPSLDREGRIRAAGAYSNGQGVIQAWRTKVSPSTGTRRLVTPRELWTGESLDPDSNQQSLAMQPGESVELRAGNVVKTGPLPRGSYELSVEYLTLSGKLIASAKATFEIQ